MTPTPGPPYEWDEDKRRGDAQSERTRLCSRLPDRLDRSHPPETGTGRRDEVRLSETHRPQAIPYSLDSKRLVHQNNQPQKGQQQGDCTI